jgi:hypothetical protein
VQADEEVQDTPLRVMSCPVRRSVGTIRQALPFQTSASVPTALPELSKRVPTAMQADSEVQATLDRMDAGPEGLGVAWMRHLVPFHRSARVLPFREFPTAVQAERVAHDTLFREPPLAGLGVAWMRHMAPIRRSARVVPLAVPPTAVHTEVEVHDALVRRPPPAGVGVGWMRQVWPFHCSASVATVRDLLVVAPTAVQAERAVHATPLRELDAAPAGLGAAWVRHVVPADRSTRTAGDWLVLEYPTAVQVVAGVHARPIRKLGPWLGVAWRCQLAPFQCSARVCGVPELLK